MIDRLARIEARLTAGGYGTSNGRDKADVRALVDIAKAARVADQDASAAHDAIYAEPFDRQAASDAIWRIHGSLRAALDALEGEGA